MATVRETSHGGNRRVLVPDRLVGAEDGVARQELVSGVRVTRLGPDTELALEVRGILTRGRLEVPSRDVDELVRRLFNEPTAREASRFVDLWRRVGAPVGDELQRQALAGEWGEGAFSEAWEEVGARLGAVEDAAAVRDFGLVRERRRALLQCVADLLRQTLERAG